MSSQNDPSLLNWLKSHSRGPPILVLDGGVSTHLENMIHPQQFPHRELWSSSLLLTKEGRVKIQQGHGDWLRAGADILSTCTYQCHFGTSSSPSSPPVVKNSQEMQEIMTFGVQLAKNAVDDYHAKTTTTTDDPRLHYVMASSGCYGAALADGSEYTGNYPPFMTFERLVDFHWKKASVLVEAQPDGLAIETIPSLDECQAACKMLQRLLLETNDKNKQTPHHDLAVWVSLACQNESQLNDGHSLLSALEAVRSMDPDAKLVHAIGINCCNPLFVPSLLKIMVKDMAIKGPLRGIVVYPNSGEEWDHINADWKEGTGVQSSEEFSQQIFEAMKLIQSVWQEETTRKKSDVVSKNYEGDQHCPKIIVGGCCRTSPRTIEKIRALVDELNLR